MPRAEMVDIEAALDLITQGLPRKEIAEELGVSVYTLGKRIADIQKKQGLLLQYRAIQSLQLTELQARVLEAITLEKIEDAPLRDLVGAYQILKKGEQSIEGPVKDMKGLVAHLIELERQEMALKEKCEGVTDAEYEEGEGESSFGLSLEELDREEF